jgi:hypothetical protein
MTKLQIAIVEYIGKYQTHNDPESQCERFDVYCHINKLWCEGKLRKRKGQYDSNGPDCIVYKEIENLFQLGILDYTQIRGLSGFYLKIKDPSDIVRVKLLKQN